jgi:uncharacterized protein YjbI with pentapeptide repeats
MLKDFAKRQVQILLIAANPTTTPWLRLGIELRAIDRAIRRSQQKDKFRLRPVWCATPDDIFDCLTSDNPDIVHFSGHATAKGELVVEDEQMNNHILSIDALGKLIARSRKDIRCVVLNACYTTSQAEVISRYIEYVISMSNHIGDDAAANFSAGFYQALGIDGNVKRAFLLGRSRIDLQNLGDEDKPQLFWRGKHLTLNEIDGQIESEEKYEKSLIISPEVGRANKHKKRKQAKLARVVLKIDRAIESFLPEDQERLEIAINQLLHLTNTARILKIATGSVLATVELPVSHVTDLYNSVMNGELEEYRVIEIDLRGIDLREAELDDITFSGADLRGANFAKAQLKRSSFSYANLAGANFTYADLRDADFTGANLTGVDLRGANGEGIKLRNAITKNILFDPMDANVQRQLYRPSNIEIDLLDDHDSRERTIQSIVAILDNPHTFSRALSHYLNAKNAQPSQFVVRVKVAESTVRRWLNGSRLPNRETLIRIGLAIGLASEERAKLLNAWTQGQTQRQYAKYLRNELKSGISNEQLAEIIRNLNIPRIIRNKLTNL